MRGGGPLVLGVGLVLAACAGSTAMMPSVNQDVARTEALRQRELFLQDYRDGLRRADAVFVRVARANSDICDRHASRYLGAMMTTVEVYPTELREAARTVFGASDAVTVHYVAPDSPAEAAGFAEGDRIVAVGGTPIGTGTVAMGQASKLMREGGTAKGSVDVTIARAGGAVQRTLTAFPEQICDYGFSLAPEESLNAYANGQNVVLHMGLVRFTQSDADLAMIFWH